MTSVDQAGDVERSITYTRMIDLSTGIAQQAVHEPWPPSISPIRHDVEVLEWMERMFGVTRDELTVSGGSAQPSRGHGDHALQHARRRAVGLRSDLRRRAGEAHRRVPARVLLQRRRDADLRHKQPGERISFDDLERALAAIGHRVAPLEIVMP